MHSKAAQVSQADQQITKFSCKWCECILVHWHLSAFTCCSDNSNLRVDRYAMCVCACAIIHGITITCSCKNVTTIPHCQTLRQTRITAKRFVLFVTHSIVTYRVCMCVYITIQATWLYCLRIERERERETEWDCTLASVSLFRTYAVDTVVWHQNITHNMGLNRGGAGVSTNWELGRARQDTDDTQNDTDQRFHGKNLHSPHRAKAVWVFWFSCNCVLYYYAKVWWVLVVVCVYMCTKILEHKDSMCTLTLASTFQSVNSISNSQQQWVVGEWSG